MRGNLHKRLVELLTARINAKVGITQESLAGALGMHQTTISGILKRSAGTFDLDEAATALEHVGSSLLDFLAGEPPRELSSTERLARALAGKPQIAALIEDLLLVPKPKLGGVLELAHGIARVAKRPGGGRTGGSKNGPRKGPRTTKGPKPRR